MSDLGDLYKKRDLISGWLDEYHARRQQLPYVVKGLEVVNYQINVASNIPVAISGSLRTDIVDSFAQSVPFWESFSAAARTHPNQVSPVSGLALEASGSNVAYQAISSAAVGYAPEVTTWARQQTNDYQSLLDKHQREQELRNLLDSLLPARRGEFETAAQSFAEVAAGGQEQSVWGIHARNLQEHIKGDLFVIAQRVTHKQKVKWSEFADALAKGGAGSPEHTTLVAEEATSKTLHLSLTNLAKNLLKLSEPDLRDIKTELNEHLFTVLSLVNDATIVAHR